VIAMRLIFVGAPGVGKGTQARLLQERHGVPHLASGDLLREAIEAGSRQGREIETKMQSGALVPDAWIQALIFQKIEALGSGRSFSLDGFPRTPEQAKALEEMLRRAGQAPVDLVIDFEMEPEAIIRRLSGRRVCPKCRMVFHLTNLKPYQEGVCDRCGTKLTTRSDDQPGTIQKRLAVYERETKPLLDFYEAAGILRHLPGDLSVSAQYDAMIELLTRERLVGAA